jgi:iron complex transport system substrate-binding protein
MNNRVNFFIYKARRTIMRKVFDLILALMVMVSFGACRARAAQDGNTAARDVTDGAGTRIVTDVWGREVEIPAKVEGIICLGSGGPRMAAYLNVMDMLIGAEDADIRSMTVLRDYSPVYHEALKKLPSVGQGGGSGNNNGYPEQIITLAPDVILAGFSAEAADELQKQTNIPVVSVRYISNGLANDTFYEAMRLFAEVVGAQERNEAVLSFIDDCKEDMNRRTAGIPDREKLKAYTGAVTFNGRHGFAGTYSKFGPFTVINAVNAADEVSEEGFYEADLEKIIMWNPDVIFLDPGNMGLVNDEYAANPAYFRNVRAVQEGRVYTMPSFNNMGTNISYALMDAYYAGIVLFPEQFADVDIAEKSGEILTLFLGENIYNIMAEGGLYYGTITLGE